MKEHPNFLTCPGVPELEPPHKAEAFRDSPTTSNPPNNTSDVTSHKSQVTRKKKRWLWGVAAVLVIILGIITVPPGIALAKAGLAANNARVALSNMQTALLAGDMATAQAYSAKAKLELNKMEVALNGIGFWRDVPYIGSQLRILQDASVVSADSMDSMDDLLKVASAIFDAASTGQQAVNSLGVPISPGDRLKDLTPENKLSLLRVLYNSLPDIRIARDKMDMAYRLWNALPQNQIAGPIKQALKPLADALPVMQRSLTQAVPLIDVMVPLVGYPDAQDYLVALQNADEIRPSGGFIGSLFTAKIAGGDITNMVFSDVYNVDNPVSATWKEDPPKPLQDYLKAKIWFMRDANWSPDFPTSADRVLDFYTRENILAGNKISEPTVYVAFEPAFFESLLKITGPVNVQGQEYNAQNFFDTLQYQVEIGFGQQGISVEDRKALMGEVGQAIMAKIQNLPKSRWPELLDLVTTALNRKQILIYSRNPDVEKKLDQYGWSGRAKPTLGDFLWVVDANLAALKTDGVMQKSVSYVLDARDPQKPVATVTLNYKNTNKQTSWRYSRYRSYTRIYVPDGSTFISAKGAMADDLHNTGGNFVAGKVDVMKELGKTVYGAFWAIEPGKSGQLSFTYQLPPIDVSSGKYRLDWPKQPGADNTQIDVKIILPTTVKKADPAEAEAKWGDNMYEYRIDTLEDRVFEVQY